MEKKLAPILMIFFVFIMNSCNTNQKELLFNGKDLGNWEKVLRDPEANPDSVFKVSDGVIHISGDPFGYIRSRKEYNNYKLHVEYRWGGTPTNSGIFIHTRGDDKVWPVCYEIQLRNTNAGDFVLMGIGTKITKKDSSFIVPPGDRPYMAVPKFNDSSENPAGEWNTVEVICDHNSIEAIVNGVQQNKGTNLTMTSGAVCLQSEGGPIQFRNVYIEPLN